MSEEIKTEDIIKSLLICTDFTKNCSGCAFSNLGAPSWNCRYVMGNSAVEQLKQLNNRHIKIQYCDERIMRQAIETYGAQAQCDVAIEEMAELTKAIMKIRRVADDYEKTQPALDNLLEEIADVDIMIDQLKIMWGPREVEEYRRQKLKRLERRLKDDLS